MFANNLVKSKGLKNKKVRKGRGDSSGKGNYSTRGLKGQKARSGYSKKPFFEGGQTPLLQRIPKLKGFKRYYKLVKTYKVINLGKLSEDERIKDGDTINKQKLLEWGYIKKTEVPVKILAKGELIKKINIEGIDAISNKAKKMIEEKGGQVVLVDDKE